MNLMVIMTVFGVLIGVLGFGFAIWSHCKNRKIKRFGFYVRNIPIVESSIGCFPGISVCYEGTYIERLTDTVIRFRNIGNETIRASDLSEKMPLIISWDSATRVFFSSIIRDTEDQGGVVLRQFDDNIEERLIEFEYIEPGQMFEIEVIHDGPKIVTTGKFIGFDLEEISNTTWDEQGFQGAKSVLSYLQATLLVVLVLLTAFMFWIITHFGGGIFYFVLMAIPIFLLSVYLPLLSHFIRIFDRYSIRAKFMNNKETFNDIYS